MIEQSNHQPKYVDRSGEEIPNQFLSAEQIGVKSIQKLIKKRARNPLSPTPLRKINDAWSLIELGLASGGQAGSKESFDTSEEILEEVAFKQGDRLNYTRFQARMALISLPYFEERAAKGVVSESTLDNMQLKLGEFISEMVPDSKIYNSSERGTIAEALALWFALDTGYDATVASPREEGDSDNDTGEKASADINIINSQTYLKTPAQVKYKERGGEYDDRVLQIRMSTIINSVVQSSSALVKEISKSHPGLYKEGNKQYSSDYRRVRSVERTVEAIVNETRGKDTPNDRKLLDLVGRRFEKDVSNHHNENTRAEVYYTT